MLGASDFTPFYRLIHQRDPFPWQQGLVDRVLADGSWPDLVDVPTGLGKTSTLDIAVFVTAATAGHKGSARPGRRRILFVVDRRIVVDEASAHAEKLATALRQALGDQRPDVAGDVARALRGYAPDAAGDPLTVTRMRGGVTWDAEWLDRPDRPAIVVGTVDQVGSRFLFRGYGISDRRKPLDAALVGTDALLLVDEAHLALPLTTTVAAAQQRDRLDLPVPALQVVQLSATPGATPGSRYEFDVRAHQLPDQPDAVLSRRAEAPAPPTVEAVEEAQRRLTAAKDLFLLETRPKDVAKVLASAAEQLVSIGRSESSWPPVVLAVCNTVDRARAVHSLLVERSTGPDGRPAMDVDLLIGRTRPADRAGLQDRILGRFGVARERGDRPAVLVATQTVEVGINIDADGVVTECASWDSLVQRLGRLNRLGRFPRPDSAGAAAAPAIVVHDGEADAPVYGQATGATWSHLTSLCQPIYAAEAVGDPRSPRLGVSPLHCRELRPASGPRSFPVEALGVRPDVPVLQAPTLDSWVCTGPVPLGDPPIEQFLHGCTTSSPAVQVAWRDGLTEPDPLDDPFGFDDDAPREAAVANALLTAMPIRSAEKVDIPLHAVKRWISGETPPPVSDLEAAPTGPDPRPRTRPEPFTVLAWRAGGVGDGPASASWTWIGAKDVRPGDLIVVPTERGGLDEYGWNPTSTRRVADAAEIAAFRPSGPLRSRHVRRMLRVDRDLPRRLGISSPARDDLAAAVAKLYTGNEDETPPADMTTELINALIPALSPDADSTASPLAPRLPTDELLNWLRGTPQPRLVEIPDPRPETVVGGVSSRPPLLCLLTGGRTGGGGPHEQTEDPPAEGDDDHPAASSLGPRPVTLEQHHTRVRGRAEEIATALGLGPELTATLAAAAGWHDLGKIDERFQAMLHGGDRHEVMAGAEPLAKSGMAAGDRAAARLARLRSGLPAGTRHEAWSAALVTAYLAQRSEPWPGDAQLLVHLIAAHHGNARPWLPAVVDTDPRPIKWTVDGVPVVAQSERTVDLAGPARFTALNVRYGRWGLALLETIVRCADTTVSAEGS